MEALKKRKESHIDPYFANNSQVNFCTDCKDCILWHDGNWNTLGVYCSYEKGNCEAYPYPGSKPTAVIYHEAKCPKKITR